MSKLKILQILPALDQGGVERGTIEIATALQEAGIENAVASAGGRLVKNLEKLGVRHYKLPLASKNPYVIWRNGARLAKIVKDDGVTLMHVRSRAPAWSVLRASRISGIPFIATWHGLYGTSPRFLKIPYNSIMLKGARTIAVSKCVRSHILDVYGADNNQVVCIHRGADVNKFKSDAVSYDDVMAFKSRLGFPIGTPVIALPGRLTYWKGQKNLLTAVAAMRHEQVGVLFVGSDQGRIDYTEELKSISSRLPVGKKVVFLEHTDDMPLVYASSDIVVSASSAQPEAFGRVIPEAQAMGRIVVGTAHGGACETICDGKTGFLVPPGDDVAMANALDRALDLKPLERSNMATAAIESVLNNFSTNRMCESTLALYRSVCGKMG